MYHIVPNPHNNSENFSAQFNACVQEICTATFIKHNGMKSFLRKHSISYAFVLSREISSAFQYSPVSAVSVSAVSGLVQFSRAKKQDFLK